jgi:hypothetical protein
MTCEYVRANAVLLVYDELPDDVRFELEQHVQRCGECASEVKAVRMLHSTMSLDRVEEPTPNLLVASRMRLQEALEHAEQSRGWHRFTFDVSRLFHSVKLAPAMAMLLFIIGFGTGIVATWQIATGQRQAGGRIAQNGRQPAPAEASIGGIRSITQEPGSNKVQISYDKVIPDTAQGSLDDPRIQQLLLYAAHNNTNSGVRLDSVDLLTQTPDDERVRSALIYSLRYDTNPGVRQKAIEALAPYVKGDVRVRDGVLEALMNDSSPGVRTVAIHALEPVAADSSVRVVLSDLAKKDRNQYIRRKAQDVLGKLPEID